MNHPANMPNELLDKALQNTYDEVRILVADDEPQNLRVIGEILKRDGLQFIFATDGLEALQAAREEKPTLILLDIMMPQCDGISVCKILKSEADTAHIPVIFLTAKSENKDIIEGFAVGGVDYITKPFFQEELLARLHTHLQLTQMQEQLNKLYAKKTELLTTLAHDVKNPAGAIHSLSGIVLEDLRQKEGDTTESESFLELMNTSAKGLMELVEGTLNEEQGGEDPINLDEESYIGVIGVLEHLKALNSVHARKKSIQISLEYTVEPKLQISRRIITEMFDNIINNAVKYSRPDSEITIRISRTPESTIKQMRFEVIDSANPIPPE
ncbi:MAG: hybrid sensor histidine kinase/response regulator, partial [Verrucomicrobiota bacterium]